MVSQLQQANNVDAVFKSEWTKLLEVFEWIIGSEMLSSGWTLATTNVISEKTLDENIEYEKWRELGHRLVLLAKTWLK